MNALLVKITVNNYIFNYISNLRELLGTRPVLGIMYSALNLKVNKTQTLSFRDYSVSGQNANNRGNCHKHLQLLQ